MEYVEMEKPKCAACGMDINSPKDCDMDWYRIGIPAHLPGKGPANMDCMEVAASKYLQAAGYTVIDTRTGKEAVFTEDEGTGGHIEYEKGD
jgi:hypothetical protein